MRVIDPGHSYALTHLDGNLEELLTFVKREGDLYPGNYGSHPGTNIQEVLRALIDRMKYVDAQLPHQWNPIVIAHLRDALRLLEARAEQRHGRDPDKLDCRARIGGEIETLAFCRVCGHIGCAGCAERTA